MPRARPTAFAAAERVHASGREFLTALVVGDDVAARLGAASGFDVYGGWDNTNTINGLGATVVAGKLGGLNEQELNNALGLSLNMLGGSMDNINYKTLAFKLPMALAARNAIFSADFAARGMTATHDAFGGKKGTGFILLPCELIDYNGRNLEECCLKTAEQWGLSEAFKTWLKEENVFCSTLVDRIVTGYPRGEAETLYEEFGYRDNMLDTAEPFGLWVIEGPAWIEDELPFKKAGCNVVFTQDVSPYKLRKVRMLNGAHTSMVLGAYLAGHEIVGDCMADDTMRAYMSQALFNEIMPTLDLPKDDLEAFASAIFERFSNPFNRHLLLSIALNSQSKFRARVLPTIKEYVKRTGRLPKILTFSMAAFIAFYCGKKKEDGSFVGVRAAGNEYPIADDQFVLDFFAGMTGKPAAEIAHAVLTNVDFWGSDLTAELPGFEASVAASLDAIFTKGAAKAIEEVVAKA